MSTSFLAQVRQQSWYPQVEAAMAQAGVPEYLWVATIASENPNAVTNPQALRQAVPDPPGFSYGLFQFHNQPAMVDPVASGNQAASIMGKALQSLPTNYTPRQALTAIEYAAWPGNDSALIAKEDPGRASALQSVLDQEQALPLASLYTPEPSPTPSGIVDPLQIGPISPWGAAQSAVSNVTGIPKAVSNVGSNIQSSIQGGVNAIQSTIVRAGVTAAQVAIALAVVAGGFALLASSGGSDESATTTAK